MIEGRNFQNLAYFVRNADTKSLIVQGLENQKQKFEVVCKSEGRLDIYAKVADGSTLVGGIRIKDGVVTLFHIGHNMAMPIRSSKLLGLGRAELSWTPEVVGITTAINYWVLSMLEEANLQKDMVILYEKLIVVV